MVIAIRERWAKQRLHHRKGHGLDTIDNRAAELAQGLQDAFPIGNVAAVARDQSHERRPIRAVKEDSVCREFVGSRRYVITEVANHVNRHFPGVEEKAAQNRSNRLGLELETSTQP